MVNEIVSGYIASHYPNDIINVRGEKMHRPTKDVEKRKSRKRKKININFPAANSKMRLGINHASTKKTFVWTFPSYRLFVRFIR